MAGCLVSLPELIYQRLNRTLEESITRYLLYCKLDMPTTEIKAYQLFLFITLYTVPMCLMAFAYINISYRLWRNDIPGNDEQSTSLRGPMRATRSKTIMVGRENQIFFRRKAAKMLITIVVTFAICFMPVHVLNIVRHTDVLKGIDPQVVSVIALISHGLCYFNSAINPVIYNFMSAKFRKEFKSALTCPQRSMARRTRKPKSLYSSSRNRTQSLNRVERYTLNTISTRHIWFNNGFLQHQSPYT
ncbi:hypothetical protein ScPMuIL_006029 [Solemya velum]